MANEYYKFGAAEVARQNVDYLTDDIRAILVNLTGAGTTYTPDFDAHQYMDDIPAGAIAQSGGGNALSAALAPTISDTGVLDAPDVTIASVTDDGVTYDGVAIVNWTGDIATSHLLHLMDTNTSAAAIAVPVNGNNVTVQWDPAGIHQF